MDYKLTEILGYLIGVPAILGLIKIRRLDPVWYPFILVLWLGLINEIISTLLINRGLPNAINSNIYVLLASVGILFFFRGLELFQKAKWIYYLLLASLIGGWIAENFIFLDIHYFNSYFRIFYSFLTVLMSINLLNRLLVGNDHRLSKNSLFLILIGFIAYYTFKTLIEIFWVYGLYGTRHFQVQVYRIMTYINLATNIIYTLAIIWMPRKTGYTLR